MNKLSFYCPICGIETELKDLELEVCPGGDLTIKCTYCDQLWRISLQFHEIESIE